MIQPSLKIPEVSILIPHYKTLELVRLCLDLLQKHTPPGLAEIIVIDNDSQDESLDYLRSLSWITLIERKAIPGESLQSHPRALDLALSQVHTPYVMSIHTDTLVKHPEWLGFLLGKIKSHQNIAGVGSWKLENRPWHKKFLKKIERKIQLVYYGLINKKNHAIEGAGQYYYYLRSHCALYRTDLLKKYHLTFDDNNEVAGKVMHKKLVDHGHDMVFLESTELGQYLDHINHATMVLHPKLGTGLKQKAIRKGTRRIQQYFKFNK